jgi:hypothetical protein
MGVWDRVGGAGIVAGGAAGVGADLQTPLLVPPILPEMPEASARELHRYGRYLQRYLDRLSDNPALTAEQRLAASTGRKQLEASMQAAGDKGGILVAINTAEADT